MELHQICTKSSSSFKITNYQLLTVRDGNDERSNEITDALQDLTSDPKLYFHWQFGQWLW